MTKAELFAIVELRPQTKDGMPVIPGVNVVYHPEFLDHIGKMNAMHYNDYNYQWTSPEHDCSRPVEECYSTAKLAMQARKRHRKEQAETGD